MGVGGLALVGLVLDLSLIQTGLWATVFAGLCVYSSQAVLVNSRWLENIGFWSYGIYLWHFPINAYLTNEMLDTPPWVAFARDLRGRRPRWPPSPSTSSRTRSAT